MGSQAGVSGPDLAAGIADHDLGSEPLVGHVGEQAVLLVRDGTQVRAIGATCTHYGGPLAEGIITRTGGTAEVRCPWHHACFDLATGHPRGPAIAPLPCWDVVLENGRIRVGKQRDVKPAAIEAPKRVVIVGGGAAGIACAEALREAGHRGAITIVSGEGSDPVDRPNLSKDYLAGNAPEEWVYLRTADALREKNLELVAANATKIDAGKRVVVADREHAYDALLLATGCEPVRLPLPGADQPHVLTLRTLADSRAIAAGRGPVVIIGASFIGLEVAASLRARGVDVTVVGPESVPLARVLGDEVGGFVRRVHEDKGVAFQLGKKPASIGADHVVLDDGTKLPAATVVMGVGVRPRTQLAADAGLKVENGVVVDGELRAAPAIWAAGDIARYPWQGSLVRIEHWQVAVRHGQRVARSMLGQPPRNDTPFFSSQHHDVTLGYVGHAEKTTAIEISGNLDARDAHVVYREGSAIKAVLTLGRDKLALEVDAAMEEGDSDRLAQIVR